MKIKNISKDGNEINIMVESKILNFTIKRTAKKYIKSLIKKGIIPKDRPIKCDANYNFKIGVLSDLEDN